MIMIGWFAGSGVSAGDVGMLAATALGDLSSLLVVGISTAAILKVRVIVRGLDGKDIAVGVTGVASLEVWSGVAGIAKVWSFELRDFRVTGTGSAI